MPTPLPQRKTSFLATDQAFYNALQAQALLKVAEQNVDHAANHGDHKSTR